MNEPAWPSLLVRAAGTLADRVADDLQERILRGELATGARLPSELQIAEAAGISRSVVRDAMRTLAARGLVTVRQGRGMEVAPPSDTPFSFAVVLLLMRSDLTMGDVIEARASLEGSLAPLATRSVTDSEVAELRQRLELFAACVNAGEWGAAHDHHLDFHLGLLRALHQPALEILLRPMAEVILLSSIPPSLEDISLWEVDSHWPILAALAARDAAALEDAMAAHFEYMRKPEYREFRAGLFRDGPRATGLTKEFLARRARSRLDAEDRAPS